MKRIALVAALGVVMLGMNSCKKCSECTFQDPTRGELKSDDVCQKGNAYKHAIDQYQKNGWKCTEKK